MKALDSCSMVIIDKDAEQPPVLASVEELRSLLYIIEHDVLPKTIHEVTVNGNKVFGAAILKTKETQLEVVANHDHVNEEESGTSLTNEEKKEGEGTTPTTTTEHEVSASSSQCTKFTSAYDTVVISSNEETICPLFHGEVKCIYDWCKVVPASDRGQEARSSVFLATHEPCCMCVSSIVWSGFTKCYFLFPYTITAQQGIPHDNNTMHELWGVPTYRKQNKYLSTACIIDLVQSLPDHHYDNNDNDEKKELLQTIDRLISKYDILSKKYHTEKADNVNNSLVLG